jgi:hypothetical protein
VKKDSGDLLWKKKRHRFVSIHHSPFVRPALALAFLFSLLTIPISKESPNIVVVKAHRAQELADELRPALSIDSPVTVNVVITHPLVFAVKPVDSQKSHYELSMEMGFLLQLDEDELRAAMAHELGHVWVFRHHPYLQTERLANTIGERLVKRDSFEKLYRKLWMYEGTPGVDMDQLLGPIAVGKVQP